MSPAVGMDPCPSPLAPMATVPPADTAASPMASPMASPAA
jgi:hypothetical protein